MDLFIRTQNFYSWVEMVISELILLLKLGVLFLSALPSSEFYLLFSYPIS